MCVRRGRLAIKDLHSLGFRAGGDKLIEDPNDAMASVGSLESALRTAHKVEQPVAAGMKRKRRGRRRRC